MNGKRGCKTSDVLFLIFLWTCLVEQAYSRTVSLIWEASPDTNVVGYNVYSGYRSGDYTTPVNAGYFTNFTFSELANRTNYFFVVTAYDKEGLESLPSNEVNLQPDTNAPQIVVTSPNTNSPVVTTNVAELLGFATDDSEIVEVRWSNSCNQASGLASGTTNWIAHGIPLCFGTNLLSLLASDSSGNMGGQQLAIIRRAPFCNISVSSTNWSVGAGEGSKIVSLSDASNCGWTNFSPCPWASVWPVTGVGSINITITANSHSGTNARSCVLTLGGQTFLVTQSGSNAGPFTNGTFNGLFSCKSQPQIFGYLSLKKSKASFTAGIRFENRSLPLRGKFDSAGSANVAIQRRGASPLILQVSLSDDGNQLDGTISDGNWEADLLADRAVFNSRTNPAPYTGNFTIAFLGILDKPDPPGGIGFATAKVFSSGLVRAMGILGDGQKFSQSTTLSRNGLWPFYAPLYRSQGGISGWLRYDLGNADNIPGGELMWTKPATLSHPSGFSNHVAVIGSPFHSPQTTTNPVPTYSNGTLTFSGGDLVGGIAQNVIIVQPFHRIKTASLEENVLNAAIKKTGVFTGGIQMPAGSGLISFKGCILQNRDVGYGFFVGANENGQVVLEGLSPSAP